MQGPERARNFIENAANCRRWGKHIFSPLSAFLEVYLREQGRTALTKIK
jgi:hypothetical protein